MRETFTAEEWSARLQAPLRTVMDICPADRVDPVLFLQAVKSGGAIVAEAIWQSDAVDTLAPALLLKKQFALLGLMQIFKSSKEGRDYAIAHLQKVAAVLNTNVTGVQASEIKQWLVSVAISRLKVSRWPSTKFMV